MDRLRVKGGNRITGEIRLAGNKNAILPMIAAALLTDEQLTLHNVPDILDVKGMLTIAESLGVKVQYSKSTLKLRAGNCSNSEIPQELCRGIRTSLLFAGPLLSRRGSAKLWAPGGDVIGRRRLDAHLYGLKTLGVSIDADDFPLRFSCRKLSGREIFFDEASVTATEHLMMTACLAEGKTVIMNAAAEPHVHDLACLLSAMGAKISGTGTNTITIEGVKKLHGAEHTLAGDHIEAGSFLAMAAATGGEIVIHGTVRRHYWMLHRIFERLGIIFEIRDDSLFLPGGQKPAIQSDFGNAIPVIADGPWPQFPSDMMSAAIVLATQSQGTVLFFEKMFESRIYFVDRLIQMGANAVVCDPHRVLIAGPAKLRGLDMSSPDIRAGMAMLIAALCADGDSIISNANVIRRGYENLIPRLSALGARIEKID